MKKNVRPSWISVGALITVLSLAGCVSEQSLADHAEKRRQTLLEMYPPRKTTRVDVLTRFGHEPQEKAVRPAGGWEKHPDNWIARFGSGAEKRIGRAIPKLERYYGADGMFSLCYCWFYYDSMNRVIDAEWQWSSD